MPTRRAFLTAAALAAPAAAQRPVTERPFQFRTLGRTGLKVSSVGFGCMITSDAAVVQRAADLGLTYFDTARNYQRGNNERMVGQALKERRKEIVLSSKSRTRTRDGALADLDQSLQALGTDHLDIWYLHSISSAGELTDELVEAQEQARKAGKIRFRGLSLHSGHAEVIPAAIKNGHFDVVLLTYNFAMDEAAMRPLVAAAAEAGMGVVAMKVMAGRFRTEGTDMDRAKITLERPGGYLAALKWVLRNPNVHTTVPSITDNEQLDENLRAMREPFTADDRKTLSAQLDYIRPLYCRTCGACTGTCPNGLPVSDILRYLSYAEGYGEYPLARENFLELPARVREVRCGDCGDCTVRCPNGVRVAERMTRAFELLA